MTEKADASPAKEFFIRMITRDIALDDCMLDLVDNSIDGAKRVIEARGEDPRAAGSFHGFWVELGFTEKEFLIKDNCGGISISEAKDYAFHFGRRLDIERQPDDSIGIYGIGMKRAMFKIGRNIDIGSSTKDDSFTVSIEVEAWEKEPGWIFDLEPGEPWPEPGTSIEIAALNSGAKADFRDAAFENALRTTIARDYSLFLQRGLQISVNSVPVPPLEFSLRSGEDFEPARVTYSDRGEEDGAEVVVEIAAGMAGPPPDPEEDLAQLNFKDVDRWGWFVLCNDRVVLAGDKTNRTVWGDDGFTRWHPQYNGFLGIVQFYSRDPGALPWTTTKRDVDETEPVYRRAVTRMKELTAPYIEYTNARKANPEEAKRRERSTTPRAIADVEVRSAMKLPSIARSRIKMGNVLYRKPVDELRLAGEALGEESMSYKDIGIKTFEYFFDREVGD